MSINARSNWTETTRASNLSRFAQGDRNGRTHELRGRLRRRGRSGHRIADRRWRGHGAEIDLIAEDGDGFIFVEVKKSVSFARAAERLTRAQMERIYRAASSYILRSPLGQLANVRFDVALVDGSGQIEIVENAFGH